MQKMRPGKYDFKLVRIYLRLVNINLNILRGIKIYGGKTVHKILSLLFLTSQSI